MSAPGQGGRDGSDQVWGLISTLVAGPAVWGGIGYGVDRLTDLAVFLPIVGSAPFVAVGPLTLSEPGLWAAWGIAVKGTLGVAASALLTLTTTVPQLLQALERLRVPRALVAIATFMIRYGEVLTDDLRRLRIARVSRGDDPRFLWQVTATAATAGALFVRAYERGERVYVAMLSRGYTGRMPRR